MIDRTAERLTKLLLMLSSDRDGEVINAVRAINRTLQDAGADWHDLATTLLVPAKVHSPHYHNDTGGDWRELREFCLQHSTLLRAHELKFITGLGGWHGNLTKKQHDWLAAIHERLRRQNK